jgi:hypothetical protein
MSTLVIAALIFLPLALFIAWAFRVMKRDRVQTTALLDRIRAKPTDLTEIELVTNDPMFVRVKLTGERRWHDLSGIHHWAAVKLFDALTAAAPGADAYASENGRRLVPGVRAHRKSSAPTPRAGIGSDARTHCPAGFDIDREPRDASCNV